jgi:inhibitor of cysteine peptidase
MSDKLVCTGVVLSLFLVMALFSGCGTQQSTLTDADNSSTVSLTPGETMAIPIESTLTDADNGSAVSLTPVETVAIPRESTLTVDDDGWTELLAPGETVAIPLKSNRTTGYSWQVLEMDASLLRMVGEPVYEPDANPKGWSGVGGTEIFIFEALAPGETTLTLGLVRPWEENVPPIQTISIRVVIE